MHLILDVETNIACNQTDTDKAVSVDTFQKSTFQAIGFFDVTRLVLFAVGLTESGDTQNNRKFQCCPKTTTDEIFEPKKELTQTNCELKHHS